VFGGTLFIFDRVVFDALVDTTRLLLTSRLFDRSTRLLRRRASFIIAVTTHTELRQLQQRRDCPCWDRIQPAGFVVMMAAR